LVRSPLNTPKTRFRTSPNKPGICLHHPSLKGSQTVCIPSSNYNTAALTSYFASIASPSVNDSSTPDFDVPTIESALETALEIQRRFFCYLLALPAVSFLFGALFLSLVCSLRPTLLKKQTQRALHLTVIGLFGGSFVLSGATALAATQIAASLRLAGEVASEGDKKFGFQSGVASLALHWVIPAVSGLATVAVGVLINDVRRIREEAEEEEKAEEEARKIIVMPPYPGA
jgi:hypothetical protein